MRGDSCQLCQCCLSLREPKHHTHGPVQLDGSGEFSTGLLLLVCLVVQRAKTTVAVRLEWPHAQRLGKRQRLPVAHLGLLDVGGAGLRMDGT